MHLQAFQASLAGSAPPAGLGDALAALWHQGRGDWHRAHELAQAAHDRDGAWVHAHLHRVEGDEDNAGYWYRRAGRPPTEGPLQDEWAAIVTALLAARPAPA